MGAFTTGWVYNLKEANAPTATPRLIAAALAFPMIATLAILLRFYARARNSKRNIRLDDIAVLWSLV
jgi:fucose 4-O-acetylase-like acetyltransferase